MIKLLTTIFLFSTFFLSCSNNAGKKKSDLIKDTISVIAKHSDYDTVAKASYFKIDKDTITVLPFEIEVSLSPKAKAKIINGKETIIVSVSLTGTPKDITLLAEDGEFYVASSEKEIAYGQLAKFENIKFPKKIYDQLTDKDVYVNVYFYSGRKSSKDNLLNGDILSDRISNVVNKQFTLRGKLIYGDN